MSVGLGRLCLLLLLALPARAWPDTADFTFGGGAGASYRMYADLYSGAGVFLALTYRVPIEEMGD